MENLNKEYMERFLNYIVSMVYYEKLLNREEITIDDYIEIERDIAYKCKIEDSVFRMKKRDPVIMTLILFKNKLKLFYLFFYKVDDVFFRDSF